MYHCEVREHCVQRKWSCSVVSDSLQSPWTIAYHAPPSMGFSRREYWKGCHFLLQGIFQTQGMNPGLLHWQEDYLPSEPPGKVMCLNNPSKETSAPGAIHRSHSYFRTFQNFPPLSGKNPWTSLSPHTCQLLSTFKPHYGVSPPPRNILYGSLLVRNVLFPSFHVDPFHLTLQDPAEGS